jgi:putative ABC transport system permease protein
MEIPVPERSLPTAAHVEQFYERLLLETTRIGGVVSAAVSSGMPVWGNSYGDAFEIVGRPHAAGTEPPGAALNSVSPDYFRTFGLALVAGREFTDRDRSGAPYVAVVNETLVRRYLGGLNPLTTRLHLYPYTPDERTRSSPVEVQIVGVAVDVPNTEAQWSTIPEIYLPFSQSPWAWARLSVRASSTPAVLQPHLERLVRSIDPDLPLHDVKTMARVLAETRASDRFHTVLFASFGVAAALLAAIGLYGVLSYAVAWRTQEIGVRMAVGASPGRVLAQIIREGMIVAVHGAAVGVVFAWLAVRALAGLVHGVETTGMAPVVATVVVLLAVALLACAIPARRAASVEPVAALRTE